MATDNACEAKLECVCFYLGQVVYGLPLLLLMQYISCPRNTGCMADRKVLVSARAPGKIVNCPNMKLLLL